jgi:uronate dehydrogenase
VTGVTGARVVLTGAAGTIGSSIRPALAGRWDLVATDRLPADGVEVLDVTDGDACRRAFAGADAVVHLAAVPDPTAPWEELLPANVVGTYEVAAAAAAAGVRRLVLASSLQALSADPPGRQLRSSDPPRPANLYGATKAWAEALGAWVAATSATSVVAVRIGYFGVTPPAGAGVTPRDVAAWLSPRDCAELVRAAVEGPVDRFSVVNGVSANRYRKAEHGPAEERLGYAPVDDAWSALG